MAEVPHAKSIEEPSLDLGGYRQELKRTLGSFQVFAISFAFISVAVGVFGTYDDVRIKPDVGSDAGKVVLLAALGAEPKNGSSTVLKIVFDLEISYRADPAEGVDKRGK